MEFVNPSNCGQKINCIFKMWNKINKRLLSKERYSDIATEQLNLIKIEMEDWLRELGYIPYTNKDGTTSLLKIK